MLRHLKFRGEFLRGRLLGLEEVFSLASLPLLEKLAFLMSSNHLPSLAKERITRVMRKMVGVRLSSILCDQLLLCVLLLHSVGRFLGSLCRWLLEDLTINGLLGNDSIESGVSNVGLYEGSNLLGDILWLHGWQLLL